MNIFGLVTVIPEATDNRNRVACASEQHCRILTNNQVPVFVIPNCVPNGTIKDLRHSGTPAFHLKFYYMLGDFLSGKCGPLRWSYSDNIPDMLLYVQDDVKMSKFFYYRLIWSEIFIKAWNERNETSYLIVGGWNEYTTGLNAQGRTFGERDVYDHWGWGAQLLVLNKMLTMRILNSIDNRTVIADDLVARKHAKVVRVLNPSLYQHSAVHSSWIEREYFLRSPSFNFVDKKCVYRPFNINALVPSQYIKGAALAVSYLDVIAIREKDVTELLPGISFISYVFGGCDIPVRITRDSEANFFAIKSMEDYDDVMCSEVDNAVVVIDERVGRRHYQFMADGLLEKRFHDAWDYCFLRLKLWETIEKG
jgi:hypothetical protein